MTEEKRKAYFKAYRESHKEALQAYNNKYYADNQEKLLAKAKAKRAAMTPEQKRAEFERKKEYMQAYRESHREYWREYRKAHKVMLIECKPIKITPAEKREAKRKRIEETMQRCRELAAGIKK